ncbi:MAG TPA: hypothetical protein VHZ75_10170 [Solirubrobacteraceae bacterium]|nr:hypothetical protein [Solirubrobacteraceae bacterium]
MQFSLAGRRLLLLTSDGGVLRTYELAGHALRPAAEPITLGGAISQMSQGSATPLMSSRGTGPGSGVTVRRLIGKKWMIVGRPLINVGIGPSTGGPIENGNSIAVPLVTAQTDHWPIRIAVLTGGNWSVSKPLNVGSGSAQGILAQSGRTSFAIWQQDGPIKQGLYAASGHLAELTGDQFRVSTAITLWKEFNIGPGDVDVIRFGARVWVMTTRASLSAPRRALRVHIDSMALRASGT